MTDRKWTSAELRQKHKEVLFPSVGTFYELTIGGELYADGAAMVVFVDMAKQKPVRIPDDIRSRLQ